MSCSGVLWLKILTFPQGFQLTLFQIASLRAFVTLWTCLQQLNSSLILPLQIFLFEVVSWSLSYFHFQDGIYGVLNTVWVWLHTEVNQSEKPSSQPSRCSHEVILLPLPALPHPCLCSIVVKTQVTKFNYQVRKRAQNLD